MEHLPLSQRLAHLVHRNAGTQALTLNDMVEQTQGSAFYLLIVLLALPFIVPISIPGFSTVFGSVIAVLAIKLLFGQNPVLPRFLARRSFSSDFQQKVLGASSRVVRFLERIVRRRRTPWLRLRVMRVINALVLLLMAVLLAAPVPLPFSNPLPSSAVILVALSMMEEDGVLIWFGYAMAAGSVGFFAFFGGVVVHLFGKLLSIV